MRINKTKAKLAANQSVIGVSVAFPSPDLVELCAAVGFDFVSFDCEHEPMNNEQIVHCIRAAEALENLDAMFAVPGVDVIHVGHMDLWQSMGMPPDMKGVYKLIDEIAARGVAAGKYMSHTIRLTEDAVDRMGDYMRIGSRLFTISPMDFMRQGGVKLTNAFRDMEKRVATQRSK